MMFDNAVEKVQDYLDVMKVAGTIPEFECFDVGIVRCVGMYRQTGMYSGPLEYNFVMGVASGMPADPELLPILLKLKLPEAHWQVTAIGRAEIWPLHQRCADLGGHLRTGLEDTFYLARRHQGDLERTIDRRHRHLRAQCRPRDRQPGGSAADFRDQALVLSFRRIRNDEPEQTGEPRENQPPISFLQCSIALTLAAASMLWMAPAAIAQDYPSRPVTLIIPWPPGGATDIAMRAIADAAAKHLGQPIVIDNKPGGSGAVGPATMAASAKPDGYTISQIPITIFRLPLMQQTSWDPEKDFSYIVHLTGYTFGVTTNVDTPFKKWQDVIDYAKANPGKVTYATPGAATSLHIGMEQIAAKAGVKFTQVPFKGNAESNAAVLGNHTMLQADGTGWKPLVDAGKLRLLMIWTAERSKNWPDVPTMKELGYPFVFDSPFGIAGPKGMDPKVVAKLHDAFKKAIEEPALLETLAKYDMVANYKSTEDYRKFVTEQIESERKVVDSLGLSKKAN